MKRFCFPEFFVQIAYVIKPTGKFVPTYIEKLLAIFLSCAGDNLLRRKNCQNTLNILHRTENRKIFQNLLLPVITLLYIQTVLAILMSFGEDILLIRKMEENLLQIL